MNKQYLLVGFPYSGKTTLAQELEKRLGFARINIDELKFARGFTNVGDDEVPGDVWEEIFKEADDLLVNYLYQGKNVANEYAWITRKWRDRAREVAKQAGFETKVIYLKTPSEVIKKRWEENNKSQKRFHWPKEELERMFEEFEEPTENEEVILYEQFMKFKKFIREL